MPAYICYKPKGSCPTCEHYRHDPDYGAKACFAAQDEELINEGQPTIVTDTKGTLVETLEAMGRGDEIRHVDVASREHVINMAALQAAIRERYSIQDIEENNEAKGDGT